MPLTIDGGDAVFAPPPVFLEKDAPDLATRADAETGHLLAGEKMVVRVP